jgi:hypothetical protein
MLGGFCTYKRVDGVWYLQSSCKTGKQCPDAPLANYKLSDGQLHDAAKEPAFLQTFKDAFGQSFTFMNQDVISLECDGEAGQSTYVRGAVVTRFKLGDFGAGGFRKLVQVDGNSNPAIG